ncbi:hypothetical protein [Clostridium butyricum]|uniref:hypothetical protein n=1 Tax=Clostridium butyricum TaxID=1492 RepID=UPI002AB0F142|nr:hypothetical protein [Clostridium butyricum]
MEKKKRTQVSFNIDADLYLNFKKVMLDKRTTPTAHITRFIQKEVESSLEVQKEMKLVEQNNLDTSEKVEENKIDILTNDIDLKKLCVNVVQLLLSSKILTDEELKKIKSISKIMNE